MGHKSPEEIACYQRRTREVLCGGSRNHETKPGRDWIGDRWETGASKINVMLIDGATWEQLSKARAAVREHLACLTNDLGLPIVCRAGLYMFDRHALGVEQATAGAADPLPTDSSFHVGKSSPPVDVSALPGVMPLPSSAATPTPPIAPADRTERLQRAKLLLEIGVVAVTFIGSIIALVWRSR